MTRVGGGGEVMILSREESFRLQLEKWQPPAKNCDCLWVYMMLIDFFNFCFYFLIIFNLNILFMLFQLSQFFPFPPSTQPPPTPTVNPRTIVHVHGLFIYVHWLIPSHLSTSPHLPPPLLHLSVCSMFPCLWFYYMVPHLKTTASNYGFWVARTGSDRLWPHVLHDSRHRPGTHQMYAGCFHWFSE